MSPKKFGLRCCCSWLLLLVIICSCKKYPNPASIYQDYTFDSVNLLTRKVLVIGIEGFSGEDFKALKPAFLTGTVMKNSKYSYSILQEEANTDAAAWKSMMTGTFFASHKTKDSTFSPPVDPNDPEGAVPNPTNLVSLLLRYKPMSSSLVISSWPFLNRSLLRGATKAITTRDDKQVTDSVTYYLQYSNPSIVVTSLNSAAIAGQQSGFSPTNLNFATAIKNIDNSIQSMMGAIEKRKSYKDENWLVMIVTNRGPDAANPNPGLMLVYNKHFKPEEVKKNGQAAPLVNYNGSSTNRRFIIPDDHGLYNFGGPKQEFTIQYSINIRSNSTIAYPVLLSKKVYQNNSNGQMIGKGWNFYLGYDRGVSMDFGPYTNGNNTAKARLGGTPYSNTLNMRDNSWYDITSVIRVDGAGKKYIQMFVYQAATDIFDTGVEQQIPAGVGDFSTVGALTIGLPDFSEPGRGQSIFNVRNVRIFNVAIDPLFVQATTCMTDITQHPNYKNLVGYWPFDEAAGGVVKNYAPGGYDFVADKGVAWEVLGTQFKLPCFIPSQTTDPARPSIVPQNADVTNLALFWLRVEIKTEWNLEGNDWLSKFPAEL